MASCWAITSYKAGVQSANTLLQIHFLPLFRVNEIVLFLCFMQVRSLNIPIFSYEVFIHRVGSCDYL